MKFLSLFCLTISLLCPHFISAQTTPEITVENTRVVSQTGDTSKSEQLLKILRKDSQDSERSLFENENVLHILPPPDWGAEVYPDSQSSPPIFTAEFEGEECVGIRHMGTGIESFTIVEFSSITLSEAIRYSAELFSTGIEKVYLEMLVDINGNTYFSRDIDGAVRGTREWVKRETLFHFSDKTTVDRIRLGVRFEGQGMVMIRNMQLEEIEKPFFSWITAGNTSGLLGAGVGITAGLCGAMAGFLAPRGKARWLVTGFMYTLIVAGAIMLIGGLYLWQTSGLTAAYPFLLCGFILLVVFIPQIFVIRRTYEAAEMRRMKASNIV